MSKERKNLANCKPSEFLSQTNRMRKAVQNWLEVTKIMELRKAMPELKPIPENAPDDIVEAIEAENKKIIAKQAQDNVSAMLDVIMDEHPQETLELLALLCFVEPADIDNHSIAFYLANLADVLNDKDVISFFTSLVRLGQTGILTA